MGYIYRSIIGYLFFNEEYKIKKEILFDNIGEFLDAQTETAEDKIIKENPDYKLIKKPDLNIISQLRPYKDTFYQMNLELTKKKLQESLTKSHLIIQAINSIDEIERSVNLLSKRLREWYSLYFPELSRQIHHNEDLVEEILNSDREKSIKKFGMDSSIGSKLDKPDLDAVLELAGQIKNLLDFRTSQTEYIITLMDETAPNVSAIAGPKIGAKLIALAGGLKHLSDFPAGTIQTLGAEKALFRHISGKGKSPKYGILINHPFVADAEEDDKGKRARALADKISLCSRLDFFKGEFLGDTMLKDLEERFNNKRHSIKNSKNRF